MSNPATTEPSSQWQGISGGSTGRAMDALVRAVEQLQGASVPASAVETLVLPSRVPGYSPALRALLGSGKTAHTSKRAPVRQRSRYGRPAMPTRSGPPIVAGRWSRLPDRDPDPTRRTHALAEALLDRHGVVTRGAVMAERAPGGFAAVYTVLKAFEESGRVRRGYFVEGLGAAQFAAPGAVDRMRALAAAKPAGDEPLWESPVPGGWDASPATARQRKRRDEARAVVLAATDPANPYGAALGWPDRTGVEDGEKGGHKPARKAGALVVLVDGALVLYVERGGKTLLSFREDDVWLAPAVDALALAVRDGALGKMTVTKADGEAALTSPLGLALENAGFRPTPRGLRLRA